MPSTLLEVDLRLAAVGLALAALAVAASAAFRLGHTAAVARAVARAGLQLGLVAGVIVAIVDSPGWTLGFVAVMFAVATATAGGRMGAGRRRWWASAPLAAGVVPVLALLVGTGVLPVRGAVLIPVAGILLGGAMTATTLAGRRALDELATRRGEVDAALAVGLLPRDAVREVCRPAAAQALVPALDQTRTVGLVALPGTFVGLLLGGATPLQAGAVQLFVLVGLLAVEAVAVGTAVEVVAAGLLHRGHRPGA